MSYSSWVSNGTNVAYEPKEKNTGEVITSFATTSPGGVPNSSYAPSTYVLAASGAWIAPTVSTNNSEISRPSVYTELTGNPVPYFSATDTNLVYDADANHITTFGEFTLEGLNVLNDASFTYTGFAAKSQTWTASKLNISRNYPRTRWNTGTEARFYLSTDSGSTWTLILTDDYDTDPIAVTIFSHTLAVVNPTSSNLVNNYQVKVEIDATAGTGLRSVGVLNLQLYDIWIEGIYAVSGGSGTVTSITTTGANGVTISGGSTQTITTSGTFALALGAITPTSIATGTGSFTGDVEFASSIKSPNASNSPVTIAPDGTGDVHLNADSVRIGDNNADATIATNGTGDLIITTHEGSAVEGIVRLYDGANGNITLTPNGSGQVKVGTDQVVTLVASQTLTNKTISGSANTLSNIANASLTNSTISGVALGGTLGTLTLNTSGTGLSGSQTYNGSGAATFTVASNATNANTASTIVARDASGNFSAGTITATLSGNATNVTGTVAVANGGTGLTTLTAGYIPYGAGTSAFGSSANLFWDSANSRLGIGTASPSQKLEVNGAALVNGSSGFMRVAVTGTPTSGTAALQLSVNSVNARTIRMENTASGGHTYDIINGAGGVAGNIGIYDDTAGAYRLVIDSSGNVGIGTASPAFKLHTYIASGTSMFKFESGANTGIYGYWTRPNQSYIQALNLDNNGDKDFSLYDATNSQVADRYYPGSAGYRAFFTNGSERVRIDSSGNVGIGTSSPTNKLQVNGVMVGNNAAGSYTKGFGGILTTTSTSTPTGGSSGDFALIY